MVLYQRMILVFLMLASLANSYTADIITSATPQKGSEPFEPKTETIGDTENRGPNSDYESVKHRKIMMSWSSLAFLIAAIVNLAFSMKFAQALLDFARSMAASEIHSCEIPGSVPLAAYACFVVLPIGSLTVLVYLFAICRAVAWFFSKWFVFLTAIALDRFWFDHTRDFKEYRNEFEFTCDPESTPPYSNSKGDERVNKYFDYGDVLTGEGADATCDRQLSADFKRFTTPPQGTDQRGNQGFSFSVKPCYEMTDEETKLQDEENVALI